MSSRAEFFDQIVEFLKGAGLFHFARQVEGFVETGFRGQNNSFRVLIGVEDAPVTVVIIVRIPIVIPEPRRGDAVELINRANYGRRLGRFEMDHRNGDVDFVVAIPLVDALLTHDQFWFAFVVAMTHADVFSRAFSRLIFDNDLCPAAAVAEVEMALGAGDSWSDEHASCE